MSIAVSRAENRVLLSNISWATYESLLADTDDPGARFTYDQGYLEIASPSARHERYRKLIGRLVDVFTEEHEIPVRSGGSPSLTNKSAQRGLEPDESYYIANEPLVRGQDETDLASTPPDLAIEVDIPQNLLDKLAIYADLGVPEVWVYDGESLRIHCRQTDGAYDVHADSLALPAFPTDVILAFLARAGNSDETTWIRSFRKWVRAAH